MSLVVEAKENPDTVTNGAAAMVIARPIQLRVVLSASARFQIEDETAIHNLLDKLILFIIHSRNYDYYMLGR